MHPAPSHVLTTRSSASTVSGGSDLKRTDLSSSNPYALPLYGHHPKGTTGSIPSIYSSSTEGDTEDPGTSNIGPSAVRCAHSDVTNVDVDSDVAAHQFQISTHATAVVIRSVASTTSSPEVPALSAVERLWVNRIVDICHRVFAALVLETDLALPGPVLLNRKCNKGTDSSLWCTVDTTKRAYQHVHDSMLQKHLDSAVQTLVFNAFVSARVFFLSNSRHLDRTLDIFGGVSEDWYFVAIAGIVLVYFVHGAIFQLTHMHSREWAISLILDYVSLPPGTLILVPNGLYERIFQEILLSPKPQLLLTTRARPGISFAAEGPDYLSTFAKLDGMFGTSFVRKSPCSGPYLNRPRPVRPLLTAHRPGHHESSDPASQDHRRPHSKATDPPKPNTMITSSTGVPPGLQGTPGIRSCLSVGPPRILGLSDVHQTSIDGRRHIFNENILFRHPRKSFLWQVLKDRVSLLSLATLVQPAFGHPQNFGTTHPEEQSLINWVGSVAAAIATILILVVVNLSNNWLHQGVVGEVPPERGETILPGSQTRILPSNKQPAESGPDSSTTRAETGSSFAVRCNESDAMSESDTIKKLSDEERILLNNRRPAESDPDNSMTRTETGSSFAAWCDGPGAMAKSDAIKKPPDEEHIPPSNRLPPESDPDRSTTHAERGRSFVVIEESVDFSTIAEPKPDCPRMHGLPFVRKSPSAGLNLDPTRHVPSRSQGSPRSIDTDPSKSDNMVASPVGVAQGLQGHNAPWDEPSATGEPGATKKPLNEGRILPSIKRPADPNPDNSTTHTQPDGWRARRLLDYFLDRSFKNI